MEPIRKGMQGHAVEDVQARLGSLGFEIDAAELSSKEFGASTEQAVRAFSEGAGLEPRSEVDLTCWSALVDASYQLGDRTLYLRVPNFHGADVRALQQALNTLGFACGEDDGYFGPHTEAALKQFQENVGVLADGMAFQDTYGYLNRLHHVWKDKPQVSTPESEAHIGFARAASVLERWRIAIGGEDAIARNVASRVWNIATATTHNSGIVLYNGETPAGMDLVLELALNGLPEGSAPRATIVLAECSDLSQRIRTAVIAATSKPAFVRIEFTGLTEFGRFTANDAQALAVRLLDGLCDALGKPVQVR